MRALAYRDRHAAAHLGAADSWIVETMRLRSTPTAGPKNKSQSAKNLKKAQCPRCGGDVMIGLDDFSVTCPGCDATIAITKPQPGPQTDFLSCDGIDIVIYGGQAGGGKTYAICLEPMKHFSNGGFTCTIFRKTFPQIREHGGLWDVASKLWPQVGGIAKEMRYEFPSGARVKFAHMETSADRFKYDGAEICLIEFD